MLLSKHVWRNRRRGVLFVACCNKSTRTCFHPFPPSQLLGFIGSFTKAFHRPSSSSSTRLLQTVPDVRALHLHQQATPPVLDPSTHNVSDGTSSSKSKPNGGDKRGLPSARTCKASSVTQTVGDMCLGSPRLGCKHGSHLRDEPPSAMPISSLEQNKEHAGAQWRIHKDKKYIRPAKQTAEYCGALLLQHGFLPVSISNIVKSVPACKRTQVHFENIVSLDLLLQTMGIDRDSIPVILNKAPFMYQQNPVLHLEPKIAYLEMLGLHRTEMRCLVLKFPYALRPAIEDIQAQIQFLRAIPLQQEDVLTILRKKPMVFGLPVDKFMRPKLQFFRSLGISQTNIRKMLLDNPRLFSTPLCELQKLVRFAQGLGVQPGTSKFSLLMMWGTFKVEVLQSRLERLSNVGLSPKEVTSLAASLPSILEVSTQCIIAKLNYLVDVMKRSVREVLKFPIFLQLSLDKRIRPRHEAFVQWTAEKQVKKHYSLSYIFQCPDKVLSIRFPGIVVKKSQ